MYLFELFANIFKKKNYGVLIWLIINTVLVTFCFGFIIAVASNGAIEDWLALLIGFAAYLVTIIAALSPIGEAILRWQNGCKKIDDEKTLQRLERLFCEVKEKSVEVDSGLERNISFYMSDDEDPNAFATGRKTICVTKGLLDFSDEEIKGVLAHEFGHLSHKDTDVILVVAVGNMFVTIIASLVSLIVRVFNWVFGFFISLFASSERSGFFIGLLTSKFNGLITLLFGAVMWLWTKLGVLICMTSSRQNEYYADKFAFESGFGNELRDSLVKLNGEEKNRKNKKTLWANLNSSHPDTQLRIEKLESYTTESVNSSGTESCNSSHIKEETAAPSDNTEKSSETGLRGFHTRMNEEDFFKTVYIPHSRQEETKSESVAQDYVSEETPKANLPMKFHKFNIFFLIPLLIISSAADLVTRGINIAEYGLDYTAIVFIVLNIAQILVSVNTLIDFKNRKHGAYDSVIFSRVIALITICFGLPVIVDSCIYSGLGTVFAVVMCTITVGLAVAVVVAMRAYYSKRKEVLFDNAENNC